jgi:hypothetical protein
MPAALESRHPSCRDKSGDPLSIREIIGNEELSGDYDLEERLNDALLSTLSSSLMENYRAFWRFRKTMINNSPP